MCVNTIGASYQQLAHFSEPLAPIMALAPIMRQLFFNNWRMVSPNVYRGYMHFAPIAPIIFPLYTGEEQ